MKENYYALFIAICTLCTPEQAFEKYYDGKAKMRKCHDDEVGEMVQFRQEGVTNQEIGEMYGVTEYCVSRKVRQRLKGA